MNRKLLKNKKPGKNYFLTVSPKFNTAKVIRPRDHKLLKKINIFNKNEYLWRTFSADQIDLNFNNPSVLLRFIKIMISLMNHGITIFRLDAIAYLWKQSGTKCINLKQTHEIIKLFRIICNVLNKESIIVTETNLPEKENISYFGKNDEANWIYNFSLPPLLIHAFLFENSTYLNRWSKKLPSLKIGNSYLNFIASHDGIGLRPLEGYVDDEELINMINRMEEFGGKTSYRISQWGDKVPYEMNISFLDSMTGTIDNIDNYKVDRFNCAHAIMLSFEGVPAIYIHSLIGTNNNYDSLNGATNYRSINRYQWNKKKLYNLFINLLIDLYNSNLSLGYQN